jgi:hypothetical protein
MTINHRILESELRNEYEEKRKTYNEIAKKYGCSVQLVCKMMKKYGIIARAASPRSQDLDGKRFGKLLVLSRTRDQATCLCECGSTITRSVYSLKGKGVRQCNQCKASMISEKNWKGYEEISGDVWFRITSGASRRKLDFDLTVEEIWELFLGQDRRCAISGVPIHFSRNRIKSGITASLDRIDSSKGYVLENVHWVHKDINKMKLDTDLNQFIHWCKVIAEHNQ